MSGGNPERVLQLEALLFVHGEPVPWEQLAQWLGGMSREAVEALVDALNQRLAGHALEVVRVAGGFWMTTRPDFHAAVEQALTTGRPEPLSHGAWETLAVVAYRQPVTRLEIEALRGVSCERTLETLLQRGLIEEVGRKEVPGRPILYGTTPRFLAEFGLDRLEELPPLPTAAEPSTASRPHPGDQPGSISGP